MAANDKFTRDLLLARFQHLVSQGPFSIEAKYNTIVKNIIQGLQKAGSYWLF
ncbi:hypothetical protein [Thermodesulfatator autotrophicus]|uniref:hypothetical protein n=1 Tax=Thermodesulfatator autotrophicus TaxID=1795632 RepID=UPI0012FC1C19|nr:hypothetical protein [Thermodesulfatator autotrophicus]